MDETTEQSQGEAPDDAQDGAQDGAQDEEEENEDFDADSFAAELVDAEDDELSSARLVTPLGAPLARTRGSSGATPLARYDPLQAYMRDVQRYPLLSPEEERETAIRYAEEGDVDAAARLVTANLRLVVKIAYEYRRAHKQLPDLIQEGSIGLMQAVKKYDPYKGVKLSTYAAWWIRAYILRFILNNARLVKLGTTQAQRKLFFNLRKEKAKLSAMGIEPTPETIAKRLNVTSDEVVQMDRRLAAGDMSLDAPVRSDEEAAPARVDLLPYDGQSADQNVAEAEVSAILQQRLREFGKTLSGKDAKIFHERMLADEPKTLQELGTEFGVSRERVRQLEKRLQLRLRDHLSKDLGPEPFGE
ncbi:MAG: RNA polymerase factor sigma-32 [Myxococcales bacterium]|nr:RNA polymerase factor sigma-32 [Myxococcales bacterium]